MSSGPDALSRTGWRRSSRAFLAHRQDSGVPNTIQHVTPLHLYEIVDLGFGHAVTHTVPGLSCERNVLGIPRRELRLDLVCLRGDRHLLPPAEDRALARQGVRLELVLGLPAAQPQDQSDHTVGLVGRHMCGDGGTVGCAH